VHQSRPPNPLQLLDDAVAKIKKPIAVVLAGHNGSGKSTMWNKRLSDRLEVPLINADRLTLSILPDRDPIPEWAQAFRDKDERWQQLSQQAVRAFTSLIMERKLPFALETVFSHWEHRPNGSYYSSKIEEIQNLQQAGYFVVLLFVGLVSAELSFFRVQTRYEEGGHDVPQLKIFTRFPRTQAAVGAASLIADMTLMFDNSRTKRQAFTLTRAQRRSKVLYDCRDDSYLVGAELRAIAGVWLERVVGEWPNSKSNSARPKSPRRKK
jgi:predicted ABC-type ATPase